MESTQLKYNLLAWSMYKEREHVWRSYWEWEGCETSAGQLQVPVRLLFFGHMFKPTHAAAAWWLGDGRGEEASASLNSASQGLEAHETMYIGLLRGFELLFAHDISPSP